MRNPAAFSAIFLSLMLSACGGGSSATTTAPAISTTTPGTAANVTTIYAGPSGSSISSGTSSTPSGGSAFSVNGQDYPQGIAVDAGKGLLYVVNSRSASIIVIPLANPTQTKSLAVSGVSSIGLPTGIALSNDGNTLYVADWTNASIYKIVLNPNAAVASATVFANSSVGLDNPAGLSLSADGASLFVANHGATDILRIPTAGGSTQSYGLPGAENSWDVFATASDVYATSANGALGFWPINGVTVGTFQAIPINFAQPCGLTEIDGYLYVADYKAQTISKIDAATGALVATMNVAPYQPFFLATDGVNLYFTDGNSGSVNEISRP